MSEPLLRLSDVNVGFNEDLVQDVSLEVHSGEIIAVLGQSGIGKTTLIRTIAGLIRPRQGSVELQLPMDGGLGYIPQRLGLIRHASVYHNVNLGARASLPLFKGNREERARRVTTAISAMGLVEKVREPIRRLSGGQLRRVATARALAQQPALLLADEFLSELDHTTVDVVVNAVKTLTDAGNSLIMVEHHEENVEMIATRIWLIENQQLIDMSIDEWHKKMEEEE